MEKMILGNKCDVLPHRREVSREEGQSLAAEYGVPFMEISAKIGINIVKVIITMQLLI